MLEQHACRAVIEEWPSAVDVKAELAQYWADVNIAAANLLYFLHPTLIEPFNAAIVKGYGDLGAIAGSPFDGGSAAISLRATEGNPAAGAAALALVQNDAAQRVLTLDLRFLAYSDLAEHRETRTRLGPGLRPLDALALPLRTPG